MSDYKDVENLWAQRNLEDKEKGINPPRVTPASITDKTAQIKNINENQIKKRITAQMVSQIIVQKFGGVEISSEQLENIVGLANDAEVSFDNLDSFVENKIFDLLKQQALEEDEEIYQPLKLEHANVDKQGLDEKLKENKKDKDPFKAIKTPIPTQTQQPTEPRKNIEEINKDNEHRYR